MNQAWCLIWLMSRVYGRWNPSSERIAEALLQLFGF